MSIIGNNLIRISHSDLAVRVAHCDVKIQEIKSRDEYDFYNNCIHEVEVDIAIKKILMCEIGLTREEEFKKICQDSVLVLDIQIKLIQVEKQVYTALAKTTRNASLFPLFLSKVDELISKLYEIFEEFVRIGLREEVDYLALCRDSLKMRNYLKDLCWAGEFQNKIAESQKIE
jgi:hypothetical protein